MIEPRTRRERVLLRMADLLAEKLAGALNSETSAELLMTVAAMEAEDQTPPRAPRVRVEFRVATKEKA